LDPKKIAVIGTVSAAAAVKSVELCIERGIPNYIIVAGAAIVNMTSIIFFWQ